MNKMLEYPLIPSPEEQERMKKDGTQSFELTIKLPVGAVVRRVNARIREVTTRGVHPQTKEIGTSVQLQEEHWMWIEGDEEKPLLPRKFYIFPSGLDIPKFSSYVGTYLLAAGRLVLHVYEDSSVLE